MSDYDVVVIGSGAGGLTAAVALAQGGQRVLVLEQHDVPGGWCHSFTLEGHKFSPGVHYIGELGPGGHMRKIYEGLGVSQDVEFMELNPDGYDHVRIGTEAYDIPKGKQAFADALSERFPHERRGIQGYLDDVQRLSDQLRAPMGAKSPMQAALLPWRMRTLLTKGLTSLDRLLDQHVSDPALRTVLAIQCGDHGLSPARVPAALHAAIAGHYFEGGFYPRGGAFKIPRAFVRALKRAGGEIRLKAAVDEILVRDGRAVGVRLADGSEISARAVVSNADPGVTFGRLMRPEHLSRRLERRLGRTKYSISALSLFFTLDMDLAARGFDSGNYWYTRTADLGRAYRVGGGPETLGAEPFESAFITITTLKDRSKQRGKTHTLEAFTFVDGETFSQWAGSKYGARPDDYEATKARLTDRMLELVEQVIPGARDHVSFSNLGTPLTNRHYVMATQGSLYGIEKTLGNIGPFAFPTKSEVDGLYLCGASTVGHGVAGATMSGIEVAKVILRCRTRDILNRDGPELVTYPADDVAAWPEALRARLDRNGYDADARPDARNESQDAA